MVDRHGYKPSTPVTQNDKRAKGLIAILSGALSSIHRGKDRHVSQIAVMETVNLGLPFLFAGCRPYD
ncbi:hypothetical protein ACTXT7_003281 [Hymenolepis weldensis]